MVDVDWSHLAHLTVDEFKERLKEPLWRLRNLYYVRDKKGNTVLFTPWPEQEKFLRRLWYRNVVPKARQRGFSTMIQLMMLDACLFVPNTAAAIIAQDKNTAKKIFDDKINFAYERLPPVVREGLPLTTDTVTEMKWSNGSSMVVSTSTRGNTLQWLHVSEYGQICKKFPGKATEIQTGSLPSVDASGVIVVESTVETPFGIFSEMVRHAKAVADLGRPLAREEYRLHFASWWDADEYETDPRLVTVSPKDNAYFEALEASIGVELGIRKRAWYVATRRNAFNDDDEKMWSQYPSTLDEAFSVSSDGLWLSKVMSRARVEGRIGKVPFIPGIPVDTWWDLGLDDDQVIWFSQNVGPWVHWIDFMETNSEPPSFFVRELQRKPYIYGSHYLPHDANQRKPNAKSLQTYADMLEDGGLRNIVIVDRIDDLTLGIDQMRAAFPTYRFDEAACAEGLKHLDLYQKTWNDRTGTWQPIPLKNGHQHAADGLRQHGQYRHLMKVQGPNTGKTKKRRVSGLAA